MAKQNATLIPCVNLYILLVLYKFWPEIQPKISRKCLQPNISRKIIGWPNLSRKNQPAGVLSPKNSAQLGSISTGLLFELSYTSFHPQKLQCRQIRRPISLRGVAKLSFSGQLFFGPLCVTKRRERRHRLNGSAKNGVNRQQRPNEQRRGIGLVKAKFHYAILVADRSEAGCRPVADLLARASSLLVIGQIPARCRSATSVGPVCDQDSVMEFGFNQTDMRDSWKRRCSI